MVIFRPMTVVAGLRGEGEAKPNRFWWPNQLDLASAPSKRWFAIFINTLLTISVLDERSGTLAPATVSAAL